MPDDRRSSTTFAKEIIDAGIRAPVDYPLGFRIGLFFLLGSLADNAVTVTDLTQDVVDTNILLVAGSAVDLTGTSALTPVDNPRAVLAIEGAAYVPLTTSGATATVDSQRLTTQAAVRSNLVHAANGGQVHSESVADLLDSNIKAVAAAAAEGGAYALGKVEVQMLRKGSMWVNLERDTFHIKPVVATDLAAAAPFMLVVAGGVINNAGWLPTDTYGRCDDNPSGWASMVRRQGAERAIFRGLFGGKGNGPVALPTAK